jgi:choline dehydrogenase-like flavoprotein
MTKRPKGVFGREDYTGDTVLACDVVIVGSGAGGGVMAAELAEAGLDVIVLEEGGYNSTEEFTPRATEMIRKMYRDGGASMTIGTPPVIFSEGRTVGGSTVINGGMSWRTPEKILERWHHDDGVDKIRAADMDRYFARVEKYISAKHQDPESSSRDNEILIEGAQKKNWAYIPNIRNQNHCAGTNNCAFGCPTAAKRSVLVTYIPRALTFGARVYSDVKVDKLVTRGKRIIGVTGHTVKSNGKAGHTLTVHARATVVACGAIHTPALLFRSGLKSPSGRIGTDLSLHPNTKVQAIFDEDVKGWQGVHQGYQVREFEKDGVLFAAVNVPPAILSMALPYYGQELLDVMNQYNKIVNAGLLLEDSTTGRVRLGPGGIPLSTYSLNDVDAAKLVKATVMLCELLFAAGAKKIAPPFEGCPVLYSMDDAKKLYSAKIPKTAIELFTVHMMGTARMGNDPTRHVVDSYGKFYDAEGLYISDASLFPSPIGVNPMETIMALSTRNAERLLETQAAKVAA